MKKRIAFRDIPALLLAAFLLLSSLPSNAAEIDLNMQDISFTTPDGMHIVGSWIIPEAAAAKKSKKVPVVLLLHDYGLNRRDWNVFIPDLVEHGYGVLAIDLRGHGQSRREEAASPPTREDVLQYGVGDIQAMLTWLKSHTTSGRK